MISGKVKIGNNNWIGPLVSIGTPPEHREFHNKPLGQIVIGNGNVIHEHTAIQSPTIGTTEIGSECFLMHSTHVAHDCFLADKVTIAPMAVLAGHVNLGYASTLGIGVAIHQHLNIGPFAMIGMNSTVTKDVKAATLVAGSPARYVRANTVGLERNGVPLGDWVDQIPLGLTESTPGLPVEIVQYLHPRLL